MNHKKIIQLGTAAVMASSAFVTALPAAQASSLSKADVYYNSAVKYAKSLNLYLDSKHKGYGKVKPVKELNSTKSAYAKAKKEINKLKGSKKKIQLAKLDAQVNVYIKRGDAYIAAITAAEKLAPLNKELSAKIRESKLDAKTTDLNNKLTAGLKKANSLISKVYGVTNRKTIIAIYTASSQKTTQTATAALNTVSYVNKGTSELQKKNKSQTEYNMNRANALFNDGAKKGYISKNTSLYKYLENKIKILKDGYNKAFTIKDSTLIASSFEFDKKAENQKDFVVTIAYNGNTLTSIKNQSQPLKEGTQFVKKDNQVIIKKEFLASLSKGENDLLFSFDKGKSTIIKITVTDQTAVTPVETNPAPAVPVIPGNPVPTIPSDPAWITDKEIKNGGTYGTESNRIVIDGDFKIDGPGVTVQNVTINGDLTLGENIADGDAILKNVKVLGKTFVKGGGNHSIHFDDSDLGEIIVHKDKGEVRIVASGTTTVGNVQIETPVIVKEENLTAAGFGNVTLAESAEGVSVQLDGAFDAITSKAENANVVLSESTNIAKVTLDAKAVVSGGSIADAIINAVGSELQTIPQSVVINSETGVKIGSNTYGKGSGWSNNESRNTLIKALNKALNLMNASEDYPASAIDSLKTAISKAETAKDASESNYAEAERELSDAIKVFESQKIAFLTPEQIEISNLPESDLDTVSVSGLKAGDIVRVYSSENDKKALTEATAENDSVEFKDLPLLSGGGQLYFSLQQVGKVESKRLRADYAGELKNSELQDLATSAQELVNESRFGEGEEKYPQAALSALQDAINKAYGALGESDAAATAKALNELKGSMDKLKSSKVLSSDPSVSLQQVKANLWSDIAWAGYNAEHTPVGLAHGDTTAEEKSKLLAAVEKASNDANAANLTKADMMNIDNEINTAFYQFYDTQIKTADGLKKEFKEQLSGSMKNELSAYLTTRSNEFGSGALADYKAIYEETLTALNQDALTVEGINALQDKFYNAHQKLRDSRTTEGLRTDLSAAISNLERDLSGFQTGTEYGNILLSDKNLCLSDIAAAKLILQSSSATGEELKKANSDISWAASNLYQSRILTINGLVKEVTGSLSSLQWQYDHSEVGTEHGEYPQEAKEVLGHSIQQITSLISGEPTNLNLFKARNLAMGASEDFYNAKIVTLSGLKADILSDLNDAEDYLNYVTIGNEHNQYPLSAKTAYIAKITDIRTAVNASDVTVEDLNELSNELNQARGDFYFSQIVTREGERQELAQAIQNANDNLDHAVEGTEDGQYPVGSKANLQQSVAAAQAVYEKTDSTVKELQNANNDLSRAKSAFYSLKKVTVAGLQKVWMDDIKGAEDNINHMLQAGANSEYTTEAINTYVTAIHDAKEIASSNTATIEEVQNGMQAFYQATSEFYKSRINNPPAADAVEPVRWLNNQSSSLSKDEIFFLRFSEGINNINENESVKQIIADALGTDEAYISTEFYGNSLEVSYSGSQPIDLTVSKQITFTSNTFADYENTYNSQPITFTLEKSSLSDDGAPAEDKPSIIVNQENEDQDSNESAVPSSGSLTEQSNDPATEKSKVDTLVSDTQVSTVIQEPAKEETGLQLDHFTLGTDLSKDGFNEPGDEIILTFTDGVKLGETLHETGNTLADLNNWLKISSGGNGTYAKELPSEGTPVFEVKAEGNHVTVTLTGGKLAESITNNSTIELAELSYILRAE